MVIYYEYNHWLVQILNILRGAFLMVIKKEQRAQETKNLILKAAGKLFSIKGYDAVTMREIAKEAGCSHTTIYLYFKDKEALLHQLAMPTLQKLYTQLSALLKSEEATSLDKLKNISHVYIIFGLENQNMYSVLINAKSSKVDEAQPELEINKLRIKLFEMLMEALQHCLSIPKGEQLLTYTRIFYYHLNGILTTYSYMHESLDTLLDRLTPTFDLSIEILIAGFRKNTEERSEYNESN